MHLFISKQNNDLVMDLEGRGMTFRYKTGHGIFHVGQSWASIHALLARLRNWQQYSARNQSITAWMQGEELCLRFCARELKFVEECKFSPEETARIMDFLGRAPNLN